MRGWFEQQMPDSEERTVLMEQKFTGANKERENTTAFFFHSSLPKTNMSEVLPPAFG